MTNEILIISLVFVGISALVSMELKGKFQAYGKIPLTNGMTGKEVAEKMLREMGFLTLKWSLLKDFFLTITTRQIKQ